MRTPKKPLLVGLWLLAVLALVGLDVLAWGDAAAFFAHPARAGMIAVWVLLGLAALFSGASGLSAGRREDRRNRWVMAPLVLIWLAMFWLVPYSDRRGLWVIDGDAARYLGLALFTLGGVIRVSAIYTLGHRFSGLVAIQQNHSLVTDGLYRTIRHPSYLGMLLLLLGAALVFRSALGLLLTALLLLPLIARMNAEEAFLESEFGDDYATYRRRTWRLVPGVY